MQFDFSNIIATNAGRWHYFTIFWIAVVWLYIDADHPEPIGGGHWRTKVMLTSFFFMPVVKWWLVIAFALALQWMNG